MILVWGLIDRQAQRLQRYGERVRVVARNDHLRRWEGVDWLILCTKFIDHREQAQAVKLYGRDRVRLVYGGDSAIRREVERLLTK